MTERRLLVLAPLVAAVVAWSPGIVAQREPAAAASGLVQESGAPSSVAAAMRRAAELRQAGPADGLRLRAVPIYTIDASNTVQAQALERAQPCGVLYLVESTYQVSGFRGSPGKVDEYFFRPLPDGGLRFVDAITLDVSETCEEKLPATTGVSSPRAQLYRNLHAALGRLGLTGQDSVKSAAFAPRLLVMSATAVDENPSDILSPVLLWLRAAQGTDRLLAVRGGTETLLYEPADLRYAVGPSNGRGLALARAKATPGAGPESALRIHEPLPIYVLDFADLALGKGPEAARPCGYRYIVESTVEAPAAGGGPARLPRFVTNADVALQPFCASRIETLSAADSAPMPARILDQVQRRPRTQGVYEPRLLVVTDVKPAPSRTRAVITSVWWKSLGSGGDMLNVWHLPTTRLNKYDVTPAAAFGPALRAWASPAEMHSYFHDRFLRADGNGGARAASDLMALDGAMSVAPSDATEQRSTLETVELIGVAKHSAPVAFAKSAALASDGHHRDSSRRPQTRALTPFETRSLASLREGHEVVTETRGSNRLVVGAIRARTNCLGCHAGYKEGDVLGALTYRLTIVQP